MPREPRKHFSNELDVLISKGPMNTDRNGFQRTLANNPTKNTRTNANQNSVPIFHEKVYQPFDYCYAFPTSLGRKDEKVLSGPQVEALCMKILTARDGIIENFNDKSTLSAAYQLNNKSDVSKSYTHKKLLEFLRKKFVLILKHLDVVYEESVSNDGKTIFYRCKLSENGCRRAADYRHYPLQMDTKVTQFSLFREDPDFSSPHVPYQRSWEKTHSQTGAMGLLGHVWQRYDRISRPYNKSDVERDHPELSIFRDIDRIRLLQRSISAYFNMTVLQEKKFLGGEYALNQPCVVDALKHEWGTFRLCWTWKQPLDQIRDYYGEQLAMYYAWSAQYCKALIIPAILGLLLYIVEMTMDKDLEFKSGIVNWCRLAFCVILGGWTTFFYQKWQRTEKELKLRWGGEVVTGASMSPVISPWFSHKMVESDAIHPTKFSPNVQPYSKMTRKFIANLIACLLTLLAVVIVNAEACEAFGKMIGVMDPNAKSWDQSMDAALNSKSPTYTELRKKWWLAFLPVVLLVKFLSLTWDRIIIQKLAKFENNKYFYQYCNSISEKSFVFKFFNGLMPIFYLAFLKETFGEKCDDMEDGRCIRSTRKMLQSFFVVGMLSNAMEIAMPLIKGWIKERKSKKAPKKVPFFEQEYWRPEYKTRTHIKNFQEVMLAFSYVCLFSVVFPLLPLFSLAMSLLEIRSDSFALTRYYRRPNPEGYESSSWDSIQKIITFGGVVVNVLLCGIVTIGYNRGTVFKLVFSLLALLLVLSVKEFITLRVPLESQKYRTQKARCHVVAYEATWGQKEQFKKLPPYPAR